MMPERPWQLAARVPAHPSAAAGAAAAPAALPASTQARGCRWCEPCGVLDLRSEVQYLPRVYQFAFLYDLSGQQGDDGLVADVLDVYPAHRVSVLHATSSAPADAYFFWVSLLLWISWYPSAFTSTS
jgi:hypothetical protein